MIKFKRGVKVSLPTLNVGEPAFTTDTNQLFVGNGSSNIRFIGSEELKLSLAYIIFTNGVGSVTVSGVTSSSVAMAQWCQDSDHNIIFTSCSTNTVTVHTDNTVTGTSGIILLVQK